MLFSEVVRVSDKDVTSDGSNRMKRATFMSSSTRYQALFGIQKDTLWEILQIHCCIITSSRDPFSSFSFFQFVDDIVDGNEHDDYNMKNNLTQGSVRNDKHLM